MTTANPHREWGPLESNNRVRSFRAAVIARLGIAIPLASQMRPSIENANVSSSSSHAIILGKPRVDLQPPPNTSKQPVQIDYNY